MAGNANRNVSVDITGDSSDLENAYDRSSKKSDEAAKKQEENNRKTESSFKRFASSASDAMGNVFSAIMKVGGSVPYGTLIMVAAAVAAIGPAAMLSAGAITLGLGSALAGIGIIAAAQSPIVRGEFQQLWDNISSDVQGISDPIRDVLLKIPGHLEYAFGFFKPELEKSFAELAPVIDKFALDFSMGLTELAPAIEPLSRAFSVLLNEIGERSPAIFGNLEETITTLAGMAEKYSVEIGGFIEGLFVILNKSASVLSWFADTFWESTTYVEKGVNAIGFGAWQTDLDMSNEKFAALNRSVQNMIGKLKDQQIVTDDLTISTDALKLAIEGLNNEHLNGDMAASAYRESFDRARETVEKNTGAIDWYTQEGRENYATIFQMVAASQKLILAKSEEGATVKEINGLYFGHRANLELVAKEMGLTEKEAKDLVDRYMTVPEEIKTTVKADTSPAQRSFDEFVTLNSGRQIPVYLIQKQEMGAKDGGYFGYASGGVVRGPGGSRTDSIPARISRGEYVVNAAATRRHLPLLDAINSGRGVGGLGGSTTIYQINTTVAPTANLSAVGQEIVESIQAFESRSGKTWRSN